MSIAILLSAAIACLPPAPYNQGPYTASTVYVKNPHILCTQLLGDAHNRRVQACYVPHIDAMLMPETCDPAKGKTSPVCRCLHEHEKGHARGGQHGPNGTWIRGYWVKP